MLKQLDPGDRDELTDPSKNESSPRLMLRRLDKSMFWLRMGRLRTGLVWLGWRLDLTVRFGLSSSDLGMLIFEPGFCT